MSQQPTPDRRSEFSAKLFAFGVALARKQAAERLEDRCLWCGRICDTPDALPYCSDICAIDARQS